MAKHIVRHKEAQYPVVVQADESGGFWVNCPALAGCYSQGETIDEALENIKEAIELCRLDQKMPMLRPLRQVSLHFVSV